jgi:hypothetical protein
LNKRCPFRYTNYTGDDAKDESDSEDEDYEDEKNGAYMNKSLDKQMIIKEELAWDTRF